jgi:hypothetical protein
MTDTEIAQTDPGAIFQPDGPINPISMREAVRTLLRALPLEDPGEPTHASARRMHCALIALSALRPREEIELMLGIQALSAYHAAAACWRLGMNLKLPRGDSTRHITAAATAARTFDTMLRALERRQAKPLPPPGERPAPREWTPSHPAAFIEIWAENCRADDDPPPGPDPQIDPQNDPQIEWTPDRIALVDAIAQQDRIAQENAGLDIANTAGIRADGSIIMPEHPTPEQDAYIARRVALRLKREWAENQRNGIEQYPKIRPLRTGDLVP